MRLGRGGCSGSSEPVESVRAPGSGRRVRCIAGECDVADFPDDLIETVQRFGNVLAGGGVGQAIGVLEDEADVEEDAGDVVEEIAGGLLGLGGGEAGAFFKAAGDGDVADDGQGEPAGGGLEGTEADLGGEGGSAFAQPGQPGPGPRRPGSRSLRVAGPAAGAPCRWAGISRPTGCPASSACW